MGGNVFHGKGRSNSGARGPETGSSCYIGASERSQHGGITVKSLTSRQVPDQAEPGISYEKELRLCSKYTSILQMEKLKLREVIVQKQMASKCLSKNLKTAI